MHAPTMLTNTHIAMRGEDGGMAEAECVETEREALRLGRAPLNVPWGFGAISCPHKQ